MLSRRFLKFFLLLCLLQSENLVSAKSAQTESTARRGKPNIILVMSDDQGWGDVGYHGHPYLKTPNLDAAASSGLRLDSFYAAAPSCSPTRASVLTGRHPNRMGVFSWGRSIRPQETTLAELLKANGYATGHFGKWHLGSVNAGSPVSPGAMGFDRWVSAPNFFDLNPILSDQGHEIRFSGEGSLVVAELATQWIQSQVAANQPFFAVVWFGSPHLPHRAAPELAALYPDRPRREREYYGEITGIDLAFGRLRNELAALGVRENTVLWFCSDNGAAGFVGNSGDARGAKHSLYEGGLRVPALIEWPAGIHPQASTVRCGTVDILPTILDIAGVGSPERVLDGISLLPLIEGRMATRPVPLGFWNMGYPGRFTDPGGVKKILPKRENWSERKIEKTARRAEYIPKPRLPADVFVGHSAWIAGDWKLHRISGSGGDNIRWQLFNLASDPREKNDLSKTYPNVVAELAPQLQSWLGSVRSSLAGQDYKPSKSFALSTQASFMDERSSNSGETGLMESQIAGGEPGNSARDRQ